MYRSIVFAQGDDAVEPLRILEDGPDAAIEYLAQWESEPRAFSEKSFAGSRDSVYRKGNLVLSWNTRLGYIGLEREE